MAQLLNISKPVCKRGRGLRSVVQATHACWDDSCGPPRWAWQVLSDNEGFARVPGDPQALGSPHWVASLSGGFSIYLHGVPAVEASSSLVLAPRVIHLYVLCRVDVAVHR